MNFYGRPPYWNRPPDPMFLHRETQRFHQMKQEAQQALNKNRLRQAAALYTEALQIAQAFPHLMQEMPKILSNRSLVFYRQREWKRALDDANASIQIDPLWIKGYWRAAQANKELKQLGTALDASIGGYNVALSQGQEEEVISFLAEIVTIIVSLRYDPNHVLEAAEIHPGSIQNQRKLLQRLANNNCWEGISLLVLGVHAGPPSSLDAAAASCPVDNLSVGTLLKTTPTSDLKRFGVELAICLLKSGASYEDIEQKMGKPVIHVGLTVALDTGNIHLIKLMFSQYLKTPEEKDAVDDKKKTAYHILVHSGKINGSLGETLLRLLMNNGCRPSIPDADGKLPIDYLTPTDMGYSLLSNITNVAGNHVKVKILHLKEQGNAAFKNKELEEAIFFYSRAITMAKDYENLTRETVTLLTNRAAVHLALHSITEALEDAEEAVKCDPSWLKGHWRRGQILSQLKKHREAYSAFLEGYRKGEGTAAEKRNILVEAVTAFQHIKGQQDLETSYKGLSKVTNDVWADVLTRLSVRGEWEAIRFLVLGINFMFGGGQVMAMGFARDADMQGITYKTLFPFLERQEDPASVNFWITPLVLFLITHRGNLDSLLRFRESDEDTPLHAATRFCVLTGDTVILKSMPNNPQMITVVNGKGDSPFHTLLKMSPAPQGKILTSLVKLLLQKGVSPVERDRDQLLPIDYVDPSKNKGVYDILLKYAKPTENVKSKKPPENPQKSTEKAKPVKPTTSEQQVPQTSATSKDNLVVKDLKSQANELYKQGCIEEALEMYCDLLDYISEECEHEVENHEKAVLYGNKAECLLKMGQFEEALEAAVESVGFDGHWFKSHLRVGKAKAALGEFSVAIQAFGNACNELEETPANLVVRREILGELTRIAPKAGQIPLLDLKGCGKQVWALTSYDLICSEQWISARFAYLQHCQKTISMDLYHEVKVSLQPLCVLDKVVTEQWVMDLILYLIQTGSDYHTLSVEKFDTYFHAAVRMSLVTGILDLFAFILEKVKENGDLNLQDKYGNTALHVAAKEEDTKPQIRLQVIYLLVEMDINVLKKNKAGKYAVQYVPGKEIQAITLLHQKMAQQEEMENILKKEKARQEREREKQEKQRLQELHQREKQEKREEAERKRQLQSQRKTEESTRYKPVKNMTADSACTNYCEQRIEDAKEKLKENNMRHGYQFLAEVLRKDHRSEKHKKLEKTALEIVIKSLGKSLNPEIPEKLAKIPNKLYEKIIQGLADNEKWRQVYIAVKEYRIYYGELAMPNFAKSMSVAKVIRHSSFQGAEQLLVDIVDYMLNGGAVLEKDGKMAILAAVQECQFKVLEVLFKWDASPVHLTINQGDTPIHAALSIALERDKGNFSILNLFFDMYEKDPEKYPMLDPSQTNTEGDGLFHLVAKAKYNATTQKATELLCDKKVNASIYNAEGKLPKDYLNSKNDRRLQFFRLASVGGVVKPKKKQKPKIPKIDDTGTPENQEESEQDLMLYERQEETPPRSEEVKDRRSKQVLSVHKEAIKRHIENMIYNLPDIPYSIFNPKVIKFDEIPSFKRKKESSEEKQAPMVTEDLDMQEDEDPQEAGEDQEVEEEDLEIDPQVFDNLEWEVECTADVWRTLRDKKVQPEMKQRIIRKIQLLAKGEWRTHLCKELKNVPPTLKLFEVKLSKGDRIIWELAIAFSPRLSESAEQRLQYTEDGAGQPVKGGRIYSEVIRVWDIVLDHDKIYRSVQRIIKSHSRGEECIIQKNLKGVKQTQFMAGAGKRFPMIFAESDVEMDKKALQEYQESLQKYYPPASSNETEYHILKFYNFDSNLVSHVLQNLEVKVDFPFRVTDLEHAIINLRTVAPILLLGRSGTGKTTCCLYRLWSQYVSYWTRATEAESKLLPRCQIFRQEEEDIADGEEEEAAEDQEEETADEEPVRAVNEEEMEEEGQLYDHLHQIFITKNVVLCSEVQKNFRELSHACDVAKNFVTMEDQVLPNRIQDIGDFQFPVFTTSKKLLLMLDASLEPPYFFDRNEDGSLKVDVQGWSETDGALSFLPMLEEVSDDEEDEDDQYQDADEEEDDSDEDQELGARPRKKVDPRREVTYEVFAEEVWPRISKKWSGRYHPSLIWMEIMSFIRGSFEALSKPTGYLSKQEYLDLGRKRAPNFSGEREHIYEIFRKYDHFKSQKFLFDETDLVQNVYNRFKKEKEMKWIIHQIYVDETQDFTQAELCLLLRVCQSPNEMFLTGDTAQSIMRGIAFRFNDLRSLFFYAKKSMHAIGKASGVKVPKQVYQLTHNYRSHAGILSLASSILELMVEFFPESFDRLQKDQGLFQGPAPVLLESCSFSDLAVLLRGNKRKTSHIEFGAHQAILVVNDAARDNIPEELNLGLILTIYEAKGLEFDDILLYNFFKDSQATKEWRVVTEYLEKLASTNAQNKQNASESLVEIDAEVFKLADRPRPLAFDPNQHKVLNAELKHLYTAVTRARVNVWIFDEDMDKRAPMFEYFKARKLTRIITSSEVEDETAGGMFAEESTSEEWLKRGEEFMKHSLYEVAAKCFNRGKDFHMEKIAQAHQSALVASRMKDNPAKMREAFLRAAEKFLECELPNKAVICLQNSREKELVAHLYEKINQLEKAGETYRKLKRPAEGSRCYEQLGKFNLAVDTLVENDLYEMAIDTLQRYKLLKEDLERKRIPLPQILKENAPRKLHTVESLSFKAAEIYHRSKNKEKMKAALSRLPKLEERTDFLIRKSYIEEAAFLFQEADKLREAVDLYSKGGMNKKALECAQKLGDKDVVGQSLILDSKVQLSQYDKYEDIDEEVKNEICENLNQAFYNLHDLENKVAAGEAAFLRGELTGNREFINKAFGEFSHSRPTRSEAGQLECMHWMVHNSDLMNRTNLQQCIIGMQNLFRVLSVLAKPVNEEERYRLQEIFKFFGFYPAEEENSLVYYPKQLPRALQILPQTSKKDFRCKENKMKIQMEISKFLVKRGIEWKRRLEEAITTHRNSRSQCPAFKLGEQCEDKSCPYLHVSLTPKSFDLLTEFDMMAVELEMYVDHGAVDVIERNEEVGVSCFIPDKFKERYKACDWLLEDLLPVNYHIAKISSDANRAHDLLRKLKYPKLTYVRKRMIKYLKNLYEEMESSERKDNIKVFVMIRFVNHLLNLQLKPKPEDIMFSFEQSMDKECAKREERRMKDWAMKLGLMIDEYEGKTYIRSIARRFCDGYDQIMGFNNDPAEALIQFTKFCVLLSNTGSIELLPHYNHLFLWMEYYTTVAFSLSAKIQNTPNFFFVIPESFISVVYFIDSTFVHEKGVPTFEAIHRHRNWKANDTGLFQDRLKRLIGILCGFRSKINLVRHIFQSDNPEKQIEDGRFGLAERLLVLLLVFVCNLGKSVFPDVETILMGELCKIKVWEQYPSRLSEALKLVQQADGPADVAKALQNLLSKRENDSLRYCVWDNSVARNGLKNLELKAVELNKKFFLEEETLQAMDNPHDVVLNNAETVVQDDDMDTKITMEEKLKIDRNRWEQERKEKEDKASRIITEFIRRSILRTKAQVLYYLVKDQIKREKDEERMKMFESAQISDSKCGICGVQLQEMAPYQAFPVDRQIFTESQTSQNLQPPSPLQLPQPSINSMQPSPFNRSPEVLKDNPFAKLLENPFELLTDSAPQVSILETREDHERSEKHKEMVKFYQLFRSKFQREISDPLEEVKSFIQKYKLGPEVAEKYYKGETYLIINCCKQKDLVEGKIKSIIEKCDWQNAEIQQDVDIMLGLFYDIRKHVEEEAKKRKEKSDRQREEAQRAKASPENWEDEYDPIEPVVEEPQREKRPRGRGKKKSMTH
ncbi:TPR and ankyrin repeat-containing protein 1-like [Saccostrea echinata]|uniref:TPR and ankyrin repeat-containing protein 1-like n=1 Tax=Saccostrea echinata TaxID=191078 RepID=UPI002A7F90E7|nr:TPR and ankyrin repeat-containing protein 1-like [Saccostrea echinata]